MLLKRTITVAAIALAMAMGVGTTYAQEKKSKKCKKTEKSCHKQDYGKPIDVVTKADKGAFAVIPLPYDYDAVADYIDAETMYIHFSKHYVGYLHNLNKAVAGTPYASQSIEEVLKNLDPNNAALRNNAGGYYNHNMYFGVISPKGGGEPKGTLMEAIKRDFGSFENFKKAFAEAGSKRFGSGWAFLVVNDEKLSVVSTANQDNPLMPNIGVSGVPILAMDVWEHAYYLKYQNKRGDYIANFFNVIDWDKVAELYGKTLYK